MLVFLIPVLVLVGATSIGIAAEIVQSNAPPPQPTAAQTEPSRTPPVPTNRVP
jgi:hypothetical protein